jgi:hypothetical protein
MSDAALTIWISCGSLLVSAGSLLVSVAAYRRSDKLRRLDRLSELSRDIAELRPRLDQLERTIPKTVQSRAPASAALGHGLRAGAGAPAVREPRGQPDVAASIPKRVDYAGIETESVTARQVSTRLEQLVHYMRERAGRPR